MTEYITQQNPCLRPAVKENPQFLDYFLQRAVLQAAGTEEEEDIQYVRVILIRFLSHFDTPGAAS